MFTKRPMKRLFVVLAALLGMTFLATPTQASAAPVRPAALSCPDFHVPPFQHAICYYDSDNFNNIINYKIVNAPSDCGLTIPIANSERNRTNSVRNRTGCRVDLDFFSGTGSDTMMILPPNTETSSVPMPNVLDFFQTFAP